MKILMVTQWDIPHAGGLSTHVQDLTQCLRSEGSDVELIEAGSVKRSKWRCLFSYIRYGGRNESYFVWHIDDIIQGLTKAIGSSLKDRTFDIIHCHDPVASYSAYWALVKANRNIPIIQTVHGPLTYESRMMRGKEIEESEYLKKLWKIEKESYENVAKIIAVDTGQKRIVTEDFGVNADKTTVILNAVSCDSVKSILKKASMYKVPSPYLLIPRRLVPKTGVQTAIRALEKLSHRVDINLVVAGDGPLRGALEDLAERLHVSSRIVFLSTIAREEVLRLAKNALAVVIPSVPTLGVVEATSIAALEAMACGTVVIASRIGGLIEIIHHNKTGFLVPHSDDVALANIVGKIAKDHQLWRTVSQCGHDYVLKNLDSPIWFSKILEVYKGLK